MDLQIPYSLFFVWNRHFEYTGDIRRGLFKAAVSYTLTPNIFFQLTIDASRAMIVYVRTLSKTAVRVPSLRRIPGRQYPS